MPDFSTHPFSESTSQHRAEAPTSVGIAVLTVSDTRTQEDDASGRLIRDHLNFRGHDILSYRIVRDDAAAILDTLQAWLSDPQIQAIIINGGTGIAGRDVTYASIANLIQKPMPGFGELFRMLSWDEVGAASMLSRAIAGVSENTVIFSIPGSVNAVRLALEKLIGPELGHVVHEINKQN
ncbi:MAG: molybdenum cofactor biosynthesis protein MoaB [Thermomicrobiales bacterium]|nr:molybdenum cofactor biosynthesis protein MoaB [Thermomicrobiales bacterium]